MIKELLLLLLPWGIPPFFAPFVLDPPGLASQGIPGGTQCLLDPGGKNLSKTHVFLDLVGNHTSSRVRMLNRARDLSPRLSIIGAARVALLIKKSKNRPPHCPLSNHSRTRLDVIPNKT